MNRNCIRIYSHRTSLRLAIKRKKRCIELFCAPLNGLCVWNLFSCLVIAINFYLEMLQYLCFCYILLFYYSLQTKIFPHTIKWLKICRLNVNFRIEKPKKNRSKLATIRPSTDFFHSICFLLLFPCV